MTDDWKEFAEQLGIEDSGSCSIKADLGKSWLIDQVSIQGACSSGYITVTGEGYSFTIISEASDWGIGRPFARLRHRPKTGLNLESIIKEYCKFCNSNNATVSKACLHSRLYCAFEMDMFF